MRSLALNMVIVGLVVTGWSGSLRGNEALTGRLVVFHAGSLAAPFKRISREFMLLHPQVQVLLEAAGSRESARKISEIGRPCDAMASADYTVIDQLLIGEFADWNIKFATNEMALVYHDASRRSGDLTVANWFEILQDPSVAFGRSNPDADPCGYRAVMCMQLAEKHYAQPGLAERLLAKDRQFIRPKETDLLALLESNTLDYIFLYRSVAEQRGLKYLLFPDRINLKSPALAAWYRTATIELSGRKPGETVTRHGEPVVYGITIPRNCPNPRAALAFVKYVLDPDRGMKVMAEMGQGSAIPAPCDAWDKLPPELRTFALPPPAGQNSNHISGTPE